MESPPVASPDAFKNRTVIVTGGAGAIGRALSLAFAASGANVIVNDVGSSVQGLGSTSGPADAVVKEIQDAGGMAIASSDSALDAKKIIDKAIEAYGRIDVIVNAAGIADFRPSLEDYTLADFRRFLEVNTHGTIATCLEAWPFFKKQGYGRIVNLTSESIFGMAEVSPYIFSKGAILSGSRSLAIEGKDHGILVNSVAPVAYSRMAQLHLAKLPEEATEYTKARFSPESNVPMIMALAHESNTITGETFSLGSWSVSRIVLGFTPGIAHAESMEECLESAPGLLELEGKELKFPKNAIELTEMMTRGR